jgi:hypothetical protein
VPDVRPRRLLRFVAGPARDGTLPCLRPPVVESFEPDEDWGWCYIHADFIELPEELRVAKR